MNSKESLDLVVLVPGKDDFETLDALLSTRTQSLKIKPPRYKILTHPRHDPGCFHGAQDVLQPLQRSAKHALVVFDHSGSGQENKTPDVVAHDVKDRLSRSGWGDRAEVLVLCPELEVWIWSDSPHVEAVLEWENRAQRLREWLLNRGLWPREHTKPHDPKRCLEETLRKTGIRRSSAVYRELAERVGLDNCTDAAFLRLKEILQAWFSN